MPNRISNIGSKLTLNLWLLGGWTTKIKVCLKLKLKIAGRKRPALADPSHKVRQGGKVSPPPTTPGDLKEGIGGRLYVILVYITYDKFCVTHPLTNRLTN